MCNVPEGYHGILGVLVTSATFSNYITPLSIEPHKHGTTELEVMDTRNDTLQKEMTGEKNWGITQLPKVVKRA